MTQQQPPILEVSHLSFRYGNSSVWGDVALALSSGQLGVLLGANGAGKSTLLRCLAGWAPPDKGEIRFRGAALRGADRSFRRRLILVNDTPPFYDDLTAAEHVRFVLRANCREDREEAAGSLLERFGLAGHVTAYPSSFSRGMRYKLALAMALALEPDLLLLDEPFGPLDPISAGVLADELHATVARGAAVLLSSHQLPRTVRPDVFFVLGNGGLRTRGAQDQGGQHASVNVTIEELLLEPAVRDTA